MRSEIDTEDFNPRRISDENRKRLKKSIEKFGLIGAPIFNKRTSHIVGGHQRLSALDSLMGKADYELEVIEVDLSEKDEVKLNVALNNSDLMGEYDFDTIQNLCKEFEPVTKKFGGYFSVPRKLNICFHSPLCYITDTFFL